MPRLIIVKKLFCFCKSIMSEQVLEKFANHVKTNEDVKIDNAIDALRILAVIVTKTASVNESERKEIIIKILEEITAGADGVLFTEDDRLPRNVLEGLEILIRSDMLSSTIDLVLEVSQIKTGFSITMYLWDLLSSACQAIYYILCGKWLHKKKEEAPLLENLNGV